MCILLLLRRLGYGRPDEATLEASNIVAAGQLALVLFLPLMMAYWFAPVLVAWHGLPPGKALFFSFVACTRNWRAFVVYAISLVLVGALLPSLLIGVLSSVFTGLAGLASVALTLLIILVLLPTVYASFYVSYRDVFVAPPTIRETV